MPRTQRRVGSNRPLSRRRSSLNKRVGSWATHQGKGKPKSRFYEIVKRVSKNMEPQTASAFIQAMTKLQGTIDEDALVSALASKNLSVIESAAGSGRLQAILGGDPKMLSALQGTSTTVGGQSAQTLAEATGIDVLFNASHPNVTMYARTQTADLVVRVSQEVKETIRIVTALGNELGLTTVDQAKAIRDALPLPPNWAQAPSNFAQELAGGRVNSGRLLHDPMLTPRQRARAQKAYLKELRAGVDLGLNNDPAWVQQQSSRYAENLRNRRARNIARTENLRAAHYGQRESWSQAMGQGALPKDSRRFWIVTADERLSLEHSKIPAMNPNGRRIDEPFKTPDGDFMDPPIRPNCRCGTGLMFGQIIL